MLCRNLVRDRAQLIAVIVLAHSVMGQDRHIVDGAGFDQRLRNSRRHVIEVRVELAVDLISASSCGVPTRKRTITRLWPRAPTLNTHTRRTEILMHQRLESQCDALFPNLRRGDAPGMAVGDVQHGDKESAASFLGGGMIATAKIPMASDAANGTTGVSKHLELINV